MRWEVPAGSIMALLAVVAVSGMVAGNPAYAVGWTMIVPPQVPLGQTIPVEVLGPAQTQFSLTLDTQPYNTSQPVFDYTFTTPTANASGFAMLNVSIPTNSLELGSYELTLYSGGANLSERIVALVNPLNVTQIEQNLTLIFGRLAQLGGQTLTDGEEIAALQAGLAQMRWAVVFVAFVLVTYIPISEWSRRNPGAVTALPERWVQRFQRERETDRWGGGNTGTIAVSSDGTGLEDTGMDQTSAVIFDPNRVWVGPKDSGCLQCSVPKGKAEQVAHMMAGSPTGHGVTNPKPGVDYRKDPDEIARQQELLRPTTPSKADARNQQWAIDLGRRN